MISVFQTNPIMALAMLPVFIFALSFHEAAHAWMANKLGDPTAKNLGRVTLNPMVHLDPIGTLCILFAPFGWARPVPYNPRNLADPRMGGLWIALAGPVSNVILALIAAVVFYFAGPFLMKISGPTGEFLFYACIMAVTINISLAIFNMFPCYPLDGEKVLVGLLPWRWAEQLEAIRPYAPMVFLMLIVSGILGRAMSYIANPIIGLLI